MDRNKNTGRNALAAVVATALVLSLVPTGSAEHVEPRFVEGPDNMTCSDFEPEGQDWEELKVDPAENGTYESEDGLLNVTVTMHDEDSFDWVANSGLVEAVFLKGGAQGHHLYEYDPAETADQNLTIPNSTQNAISHISFCYIAGVQEPEPEPEPEPGAECPPVGIDAIANQDGSILVNVDTDASYDLVRTSGEERLVLGSFEGDQSFLDTETVVGQTYTYHVMVGDLDCGQVQVTAIPVFTTALAGGLAASVGLLAYAGLRRRS